ncbi:beta-lactamase family protein [Dactylosporangium aurantiacum]|uniref:Beta-lactamase family protein n=1 Tax=Dactylosporangium aurantiacum TaxID=35754 RepID=A0A9Q9IIW7_9ACTN|nr:serine hydrolase domain-containing protein [Dactylosporangium aurantiacum]MDG6109353.1 serine hydrolase [Dactylosporangium aurantiacum]UWZ56461.1 beta-lactamase family protein [Dactylosporangium aurantiacum]
MPLLPETVSRVDDLVARAHAGGRVPVLVAGVVRDGALAHVAAAGLEGPAAGLQFRIGSITKTMTAALVLALRDEGKLALDDLLYRHLPGTPVGAVTLRQLLGHAGGVQREPDGDWWERAAGVDVDTFLATLTADKVAYPPLHGYHYSNLAYGLLGAMVARLGGEDWPSMLAKRLLGPLRLDRTTYGPVEPFARGFVVHPWLDELREEPRHDAGAMAPAGQLWSTVQDMARWAAFLAEPDPAVLAPATVAEMCAPVVISDLDGWSAGHGLGLQLWRRGERVFVGHSGSMPGYLAILAVHRPSRTGVVAFGNAYTMHYGPSAAGGMSGFGLDLLDAVLDREPARVAPWHPRSSPPADIAPLTGRWWWMGREHEVGWAGGELVVTPLAPARTPWRFVPDGPAADVWRGRSGDNDGELLRVVRDGDGTVVALDIATFLLTRDPWPAGWPAR